MQMQSINLGLGKLFYLLYRNNNNYIRKNLLKIIKTIEQGEYYSKTIRLIFNHYHGIEVGEYSYGCFDSQMFDFQTIIGRYCSFAKNIRARNRNHPISDLSTHPFFFNPAAGFCKTEKVERIPLVIGNDVWIGHGAIILPKVRTIGNGAIVGAGSVVTKDVAPFAIVAGNPAKLIKYRFSEPVILKLEESKWWLKDVNELILIIHELEQMIRQ